MTSRELLMHIALNSDWKNDRRETKCKFSMKKFWYCTVVCDTRESVR